MSRIAALAMLIAIVPACQKQAVTNLPEAMRALHGKPVCEAQYDIVGLSVGLAAIEDRRDVVADQITRLSGLYLQKHIKDVEAGEPPEIGAVGAGWADPKPLHLQVTYLKPCKDIDEVARKLLAFVQAGDHQWKLPEGVHLSLASTSEKSFEYATSRPDGARP
jgi:hypothetical protein